MKMLRELLKHSNFIILCFLVYVADCFIVANTIIIGKMKKLLQYNSNNHIAKANKHKTARIPKPSIQLMYSTSQKSKQHNVTNTMLFK